jgi:hypothetical protein
MNRAKAVSIDLAESHDEGVHPGLQSALAGRRILKLHTPAGLLKIDTYSGIEFCGFDILWVHCSVQEEISPLLDKPSSPSMPRHL